MRASHLSFTEPCHTLFSQVLYYTFTLLRREPALWIDDVSASEARPPRECSDVNVDELARVHTPRHSTISRLTQDERGPLARFCIHSIGISANSRSESRP
jgi:hypothetical protein